MNKNESIEHTSKDKKIETIDEISSIKDIFNFASDRKYNFYKYFVSDDIINQVSSKIKSNYTPNEIFDDETGEVISSSEPEPQQIYNQFNYEINFEYVEDGSNLIIKIPIAFIPDGSVKNEYKDAGAFVVGTVEKPIGLAVVIHDGFESAIFDIQHELVHLATHSLSLGSLEVVNPIYDDMAMLKNEVDHSSYILVRSFIDEFLAYGTNLFEQKFKTTSEMIKEYFFYEGNNQIPESFDIYPNHN